MADAAALSYTSGPDVDRPDVQAPDAARASVPGVSGTLAYVNAAALEPPDHLVVQQSVFAGERFWVALNRLADQRGHDGHQRYLCGSVEHTDQYALRCITCDRVIATMLVEREPPDTRDGDLQQVTRGPRR
ncbi:MAG TPA: hypothetical protein VJT31_34980 [Rugosimonospora sp.]|nr:hypothetical protein [Rugosimonospora sp.]